MGIKHPRKTHANFEANNHNAIFEKGTNYQVHKCNVNEFGEFLLKPTGSKIQQQSLQYEEKQPLAGEPACKVNPSPIYLGEKTNKQTNVCMYVYVRG